MATMKELNITLNKEEYKADVHKILTEIRPLWKREHVNIKELPGGLVNKTLRIFHQDNKSDGLILRINGPVAEQIGLSRKMELDYIKLLNENGLGVPLVASFNNGIISKLMPGSSLFDPVLVNKMVDQDFVRTFTQTLAKMHSLVTDPVTKHNNRMMILAKTSLKNIRQMTDHKGLQKFAQEVINWDDMEKEIDFIYSEAENLEMPTGLSHNDLWHSNILYDVNTDFTTIIDFEVMDVNFAPFDVATYLIFLLRSHILPVSLPTPETIPQDFSRFFIRCYLEAKADLEGKCHSSVTSGAVEQFLRWTNICTMVYLLLYTPAMICLSNQQNEGGVEDLDCVVVARLWYNEYAKLKAEFIL